MASSSPYYITSLSILGWPRLKFYPRNSDLLYKPAIGNRSVFCGAVRNALRVIAAKLKRWY